MGEEKKKRAAPKPRKRRKRGGRKHAVMELGPEATKRELTNRATFHGFMRYVQRPGASIRQVWETERLEDTDTAPYIRDVISWSAFQKASINGRWRLRREDHWRAVKKRVLDHAQTEAVKAEIAEIGTLEGVRSHVLDRILGNAAAGIAPALPKSLEGAVGAFVQLDKLISKKRADVVDSTAEAASKQQAATAPTLPGEAVPLALGDGDNPLTDEEIQAMSRTLAQRRAGLSSETDEAPPADDFPTVLSIETSEAAETSPPETTNQEKTT